MVKKIFAILVTVSFVLNAVSFADVLPVKHAPRSSVDTLAPDSRLSPITDNAVMLDIMKLTTEIATLAAREDIALRERDDYCELEPIDAITSATADESLARPGDTIVFNFREKVVRGDTVFIPCSLAGVQHGDAAKTVTERRFLCIAKKTPEKKYDFEFVPTGSEDLNGLEINAALNNGTLLDQLAEKGRPADVKEGIHRFMEQQERDRFIAQAITDGQITRLSLRDTIIGQVAAFLYAENFAVANSFAALVNLGQVMIVDGLTVPHAGGVGIYLPNTMDGCTAEALLHEILAKSGLKHTDADTIVAIFNRTKDRDRLDAGDAAALEQAKAADFENRFIDVAAMLRADYWNDGFKVVIETLRGPDPVNVETARGLAASGATLHRSHRNWYLGIDSSTKSVKFYLIERFEGKNRLIWTHRENFDDPHYQEFFGAQGGVIPHPQAKEQHHTDPLMLADALERGIRQLSEQLKAHNLDIGNIRGISGAGQQHGTVYLNNRAKYILKEGLLTVSGMALWQQLQKGAIFSIPTAPIWQDGTTTAEVRAMHKAAGGAEKVRQMTGSVGTLRFSLAQILAQFNRLRSAFFGTETVLNIAAWNGALLTGDTRFPIDYGDGAGTNAMDIRKKVWWEEFLDRLFPGLSSLLPPLKPSDHVAGTIASYWTEKYGFSPNTKIVNWTGDNPSGLTGMGVIKEGEIVVSLGTSYTMYTFVGEEGLDQALASPIGHVFSEPTGQYMNLVCFQNGDDTLIELRKKLISEDEALMRASEKGTPVPADKEEREALIKMMRLEIFEEELAKTEAGNNGAMMVAMHKTEDVVRLPYIAGATFSRNLDESNRAQVFRAAVEGQAYFMRWIAESIGLDVTKIKMTGGVSNNQTARKIFADVFNAPINVLMESEAVAMGSAIRAMKVGEKIGWEEAIEGLAEIDKDKAVSPHGEAVAVYQGHFDEFKELLAEAITAGRVSDAVAYHTEAFDQKPVTAAQGPGRINLLGEHIDYAGGHVLPIALDGVDVIAAASQRADGKIVIASPRFDETFTITVDELRAIEPGEKKGLEAIPDAFAWARYPLGVIRQLMEVSGVTITGLNISYDGNVPLGGGLSSSAAVETSVFTALEGILKTGLDMKKATELCKDAEWWVGNKCGPMDQYASLNGKKGKAVLLNCDTLDSEAIDISFLDTAGYAIVATDTGLPKTGEEWQKYMARKALLEEAVAKFFIEQRPDLGVEKIKGLAPKITPEIFEAIGEALRAATSDEVYNRVKHVVYEEARVMKLVAIAAEANTLAAMVRSGDASRQDDLEEKVRQFGAVIAEGHESIATLYEMSSSHLDTLVRSGMQHGSVGSRLTGAGIVGCTVNIVKKERLAEFRAGVIADYRAAFPDKPCPKITVSRAGDGAHPIDLAAAAKAASVMPECTYAVTDTGVEIRGANALRLERQFPAGVAVEKPQIVSETVAQNAGANRISLKVLFPGQTEPTEVISTKDGITDEEERLLKLAELFQDRPDDPFGKNPFTVAGAVIGPAPNRFVGPVDADGNVTVTFPNGTTALVPANHEGSTVPRYHLHGFFHRLAQAIAAWVKRSQNATIQGTVTVGGQTKAWPWPSDSTITTTRTITAENRSRLTVTQKNTGSETTWASWVDHSYFRNLPGMKRGDVRLRLPAKSRCPVGIRPDGKPDFKNCLPTGEIVPVAGTEFDFTAPEGRPLEGRFLDDNFTQLVTDDDGSVVVEVLYPEAGYKLRIRASDIVTRKGGAVEKGKLKSIQVYSPEDSDFVCVEIGAHLNNPFDKATWEKDGAEKVDTGMVELQPGDTYEYTYELEYLPIEDGLLRAIADAKKREFPMGINASVIDGAAAESQSQETVVFVSQDIIADRARCEELIRERPLVTFVPFNQHTQLASLPMMISNPAYLKHKKVLITLGLDAVTMSAVLQGSEIAFSDVIPLNISAEGVSELGRGEELRAFQKSVLSLGLLAAAIPKDKDRYKDARSYQTLKAILTIVFGDEHAAEEYIIYLVNPDGTISVPMRFGYIIGKVIGAVKELTVNTVARIVNIFA